MAAEIVNWKDLVDAGGYAEARERAKLRIEGRDYEMRDGDVVTFRFTPSGPAVWQTARFVAWSRRTPR